MTALEQSAGKIIFVPFIDGFGGVERLVLSLSRYLHGREVAHTILCYRDSINLNRYADWPVRISRIDSARNPISESWSLRKWIEQSSKYHGRDDPFLVFDLKGAFYAASVSRPYVVHLTDPPSLLPADDSKNAPSVSGGSAASMLARPGTWQRLARAQAAHWVNRRGVRKAARVVAMTGSIAAEIQDLYGVDPVIVRPGVAPPGDVPPRADDGIFRILSVSRLEESKRIAWVLRALSDLESSSPALSASIDWSFEIVGEGPARSSLDALTTSLGLSARVNFRGRIPDNELEYLYSIAGIFVMPAVQGYGLPALEALSRHVPVIMHRASGVSEILAGTPWVELIGSERGEDVATAITRLVDRISRNALSSHSLPSIPTDTEWATQICDVCNWR